MKTGFRLFSVAWLLIFALLTNLNLVAAQTQRVPVELEIEGQSLTVAGQTVTAVVKASLSTPAQGFGFQLRYDPQCLQFVQHAPGNLFKDASVMPNAGQGGQSGVVDVVYMFLGQVSSSTGDGTLAAVTFKAITPCVTTLTLEKPRVIGINPEGMAVDMPVAAEKVAASVSVEASATAALPTPPVPTVSPLAQMTSVPAPTLLPPPTAVKVLPASATPVLASPLVPPTGILPPGAGAGLGMALVLLLLAGGGLALVVMLKVLAVRRARQTLRQPHRAEGQRGLLRTLTEAPAAAAPELVVARGFTRQWAKPVVSDYFVIGRSPRCHLLLNHARVSRTHAAITSRGGRYFIVDLGSCNGTYLNGRRLGGDRQRLTVGDEIRLGQYVVLRFQAPGGRPA
jgi:hypothetical protein